MVLRNKKWVLFLMVALLVVALVAGCSQKPAEPKKEEPKKEEPKVSNVIKIASSTPLSGSQANLGEAIKLGAQMAIDEKKAAIEALGFKVEFVPQDDQADPKVGVAVGQKLISDTDILGVVGHLNSGVAIPSSEVYAKDNLVMVSPANTNPVVTERRLSNVNRICGRDDVQGPVGARVAFEQLKAKSAFVVHDKTQYGQGVADEFKKEAEKLGIKIVGYEGITQGDVDFSAVLTKIKGAKPDMIYFGGIYAEGALLLKQARDKSIKSKFMGPDGLDSSEMLKIAGKNVVGVIYTSVAGDVTKTPEGKVFAEKYQKAFGKPPEGFSAYGYDSANVLLDGLVKAIKDNGGKKPSREQVSKAVRATSGAKGLTGEVSFDDKGDNLKAKYFVFEFKEEKYPGTLIAEISGSK